jgi:hypothetical protein
MLPIEEDKREIDGQSKILYVEAQIVTLEEVPI